MKRFGLFFALASLTVCSSANAQSALYLEGPDSAATGMTGDLYGFVMADAGFNNRRIDPQWFDVV